MGKYTYRELPGGGRQRWNFQILTPELPPEFAVGRDGRLPLLGRTSSILLYNKWIHVDLYQLEWYREISLSSLFLRWRAFVFKIF